MDVLLLGTTNRFTIDLSKSSGEELILCPSCSHTRKKKSIKCLSWNHDKEVGYCNHCEGSFVKHKELEKEYNLPERKGSALGDKMLSYFKSRGINENTISRFNITQHDNGQSWICFNYFYGAELINIKYRNAKKEFRLEKGCRLIPYNINSIIGANICYIVEGEFDALTLYECGFKEVVSVPNGAHAKNNKLEYLDDVIDEFDKIEEIVIVTDNDEPGITLRNELARRFGKDRCTYVVYPEGCKDSNDVLIKYGIESVKELIKGRKEFPLEGVTTVKDISIDIDYIFENGYPISNKIGNELDDHIKWRTGEWTVITGTPGSGKSDVIDQISLALSLDHGWRFGIYSPENAPYQLHFWKLAQKYIGKMRKDFTTDELNRSKEFISKNYYWVSMQDLSIDNLLSKAKELVKRKGINAFILDPWNQLDHLIPHGMTETQYISKSLSKLTDFVLANDIHLFLVAHPAKHRQDPKKISLYDIAGSAHFFNKCYNGLTIMRDFEKDYTIINIEKVKFWFVVVCSAKF